MSMASRIISANRFTPELVPRFEAKLFYEGDRRRTYLEQFAVLLTLATIIATAGVIGDSTATVIGAMIVAPLMTPIMATAAALVSGNLSRAASSLGLVALGVIAVIGLSWAFGSIYVGTVAFEANSQILARTSPRLLDLVAALASGAAGAFCLSREDVSDSLPGVAIAISLVPPLCVVGVSLANGQPDAAAGAMLLFVTNLLAILLAGGAVLILLGLHAASTAALPGHRRRIAFAVVILAVVAVAVPLGATSLRVTQQSRDQIRAERTAQTWANGVGFHVRTVDVAGDEVSVTIAGPGEPPAVATLAAALDDALGRRVAVSLESTPSTIQKIGP
jgi:uncharacterized hydrophobic protein (TIGR00271 family)